MPSSLLSHALCVIGEIDGVMLDIYFTALCFAVRMRDVEVKNGLC